MKYDSKLKTIVIIILFLLSIKVDALDYVWDGGGGDNNWNTPNNWDLDSGYPGQNASDTATFNAGSTNCTVNVDVSLAIITVTTGYTGLINQNSNVTTSGNFSVDGSALRWKLNTANKTLTVGGHCDFLGSGSCDFATNANTITLNGTGNLTITGLTGGATLRNVKVLNCAQNGNTTTLTRTGGDTTSILGISSVSGSLNVGTGTLNITLQIQNYSGNLAMETGGTITGSGSYYLMSNSSHTMPGGTYSTSIGVNGTTATLTLLGDVVWNNINNIKGTIDTSGYNITSGNILIGSQGVGVLNCNSSTININSGSTIRIYNYLSANPSTLNAGSSRWIFAGSVTWTHDSGATFNAGSSTFQFATANIPAETFYNLKLTGTGTLSGNCTVGNELTLDTGSILNMGSYSITLNGGLINKTTTTFTSSNLTFNGNSITNSGNLTIPSLTLTGDITNSGTLNVTNLTITGNITNTGTINATNITVNGTITNSGTLNITGTNVALNGNLTNSTTLNTGAVTIPSGKTVLLNAGSVWNVSSGSTITVNGTLRSSGISDSLTTIQSNSPSGYFGLTINGSADLTGCKLYYLNTDGLKVDKTGTITKIDNVDFKNGQSGGTHLQVLNGQTITITNVMLDDITNGTNITVKNNTKLKVVKYTIGRFRDSIEAGSSIDYGVDARIDPNIGGKIADNGDANTYIEIPKGAIKQALTFTLYKLYSNELPSSSDPKDNVVIGYNIEAKDDAGRDVGRIDGAIVLVIHTKGDGENLLDVNNTSIGIRVSEATNRLCIGYWNERYWTKLGSRVDVSIDKRDITVRANVSHLSRYAIVVKDSGGVLTNVSPNPFTPAASQWNTITFSFNNEDNENVEIKLWDITGVLVRTITNAPTSSIVWDGRDEYGEIVEAGVYIYQLKVGNARAGKGTIVVAK